MVRKFLSLEQNTLTNCHLRQQNMVTFSSLRRALHAGLLLSASCTLTIAFSVSSPRSFAVDNPTSIATSDSPSSTTALFGTFLKEQPVTTSLKKKKRDAPSELSAVAIATADEFQRNSFLESTLKPVLSTALLICGNTVGASALVLPDIAAAPGMSMSTMVFVGMFVLNLISGLLIAEVSIKQYETSKSQVPSSFKEFAEVNLKSSWAANGIASVSVFVNACVLAFNLVRMGEVGSAASSGLLDGTCVSVGFAATVAALACTLGTETLSGVASFAVTGLFATFGSLLLPGLANVHDPMGTFLAPGTSTDVMAAAAQAAPIVLTSMVYQNIVPSVTKILDYDRAKTVAAVGLGSFLPTFIYLSWCFAVLGGGVDTAVGTGGPLMTAFSVTTVVGSSIACVMSISEELESFLNKPKESMTSVLDAKDRVFSLPSVAASVALPLAAGLYFSGGEDFTDALRFAGSYGSPLLYGAIPVAMAWKQRNKFASLQNLVPGGLASLAVLGTASAGFMWEEFTKDICSVLV